MCNIDAFIGVRGGLAHSSTSGGDETPENNVDLVSITPTSAPYHLLWSPGFLKKMALATTALLSLRWVAASLGIQLHGALHSILHPAGCSQTAATSAAVPATAAPSSFAEKLAHRVFLPLFASACCAVQLALNAIFAGAGCAGFNTYLGPLRPYFLSVMFVSTVTPWSLPQAPWPNPAQAVADLAVWAVALLPEVVHARNGWLARQQSPGGSSEEMGGSVVADREKDSSAMETAILELNVPGMGCAACVLKIDSSIRGCTTKVGHVVRSSSWLTDEPKGGKARVVLSADSIEGMDTLLASIVGAVNGAGFHCEVDSFDFS